MPGKTSAVCICTSTITGPILKTHPHKPEYRTNFRCFARTQVLLDATRLQSRLPAIPRPPPPPTVLLSPPLRFTSRPPYVFLASADERGADSTGPGGPEEGLRPEHVACVSIQQISKKKATFLDRITLPFFLIRILS